MTIAATRRLITEVLEGCPLDARARSLLQKALAESWQVSPIRSRENAPPERTPQPGGALGNKRSGRTVQNLALDSQTGRAHSTGVS